MIGLREELNKSMETLQLELMNTTFFVAISNCEIPSWQSEITSWFKYIETAFSRFIVSNELAQFNQAKRDSTIQVSEIFFDILKKAEEYRVKTEGRFSPFLLNQLVGHGYNQSFPFEVSNGEAEIPHIEMEPVPLIFHTNNHITKYTENKMDLGGIAKGYAVAAAANWLKKHAKTRYGIVDGGGDMTVWSNGEKTWKIGIMDPFHEQKEIGSFQIQNGGIATSNILYRSWRQGSTDKHHLLDGRSGEPVESHIVQATVVMEHGLDAEIGAKICFMNDQMSVSALLNKINKKHSFLLVKSNGELEMG